MRDTCRMPLWLQIALPIFTALLGGAAALGFTRLGKALDRRRERLDTRKAAEAARTGWLAAKAASRLPSFSCRQLQKGFRLENLSRNPATGISVTFAGYPREKVKGLPDEPFDLAPYETVDFRLPGTKDLLELPQMWVMCREYAEPVAIGIIESWPL
ncbi:hypothetical protein AB0J40_11055 [Amycolatopsis sp. NPDC049691]|uniref:hypothetical protein n=1 Tax=Amycolatopsis sp. NPDC049691 TaxID=3155155 RepID=UPI003428B934